MPTPTEPDEGEIVGGCPCGAPWGGYATGIGWFCSQGLRCTHDAFLELLGPPETLQRPSWDEWGLNLARAVATRADCCRAQHGAVILSLDHRVVGAGYNGYPSGQPGCLSGACPRGALSANELPHLAPYHEGVGRCDAIHAEANALLHSSYAYVQGGTIYITGKPCHGCTVLISGSGLAKAVWPTGSWEK